MSEKAPVVETTTELQELLNRQVRQELLDVINNPANHNLIRNILTAEEKAKQRQALIQLLHRQEPTPLIWDSDNDETIPCYGLQDLYFGYVYDDEGTAVSSTEKFSPEDQVRTKIAQEICGSCAVQQACSEFAVVTNQKLGVWGGTTTNKRREIRRRRRLKESA